MALALVDDSLRSKNQLLRRLVALDCDGNLGGAAQLYEIGRMEIVARGDEPLRMMLFPIDALLSAGVWLPDGGLVDVGTIGREGAIGLLWCFGERPMRDLAVRCTLAGHAFGVPLPVIAALYETLPDVRALLDAYLRLQHVATLQLAACSVSHPLLERCARLLLTMSRSVGSNELAITQETLSDMLGTRRATVTIAIAALCELGALSTGRASINIVDRQALVRSACGCYDSVSEMYQEAGFELASIDDTLLSLAEDARKTG